MITTLALSAMPVAGALWRRMLGGYGTIRRSILVGAAWIPCTPLFLVMEPLHVGVAVVATYAHFLPPHGNLIDMGRADNSWLYDFSGMALRYMIGPTILALACILGWFPGYSFFPAAVGPLTAFGYALAWEAQDCGILGSDAEPTAVGELVMGACWYGALALVGGLA